MTQARRLTDGRLALEPYAADHVDDLVAAVRESRAELIAWLPWCHEQYGPKDATDWLRFCAHAAAEGLERHYAVRDDTGHFAGSIGLRVLDVRNRVASIGYWTRTGATGRGIATSATRLLARHAFDDLGLQRIEIVVEPENLASRRVAERAGAKFEGVARRRVLHRGRALDAALYSLIAEDLGARLPEGPR
jgi:RimJ/RimL family protein N-acetyltransferase